MTDTKESKEVNRCLSEIKEGGIVGICGLDQIDWGGSAGKFYEVWKVSPCCGSPDANPKDAIMCCLCWSFCGQCSATKLFASSVDQPCSLIPHCLFVYFCGCISGPVLRYNLRKKAGVTGNIIGDCACVCCCGPCACCQELRSVQPSEWNWLSPKITVPEIVAPDSTKLIN